MNHFFIDRRWRNPEVVKEREELKQSFLQLRESAHVFAGQCTVERFLTICHNYFVQWEALTRFHHDCRTKGSRGLSKRNLLPKPIANKPTILQLKFSSPNSAFQPVIKLKPQMRTWGIQPIDSLTVVSPTLRSLGSQPYGGKQKR
uniref:Uncharacterized protein n=1 Tax=Guillardia theta TaxID=55529 RepID=A0A7S4PFV3_GUITH|mmetsp:Transcript_5006/g.18063  ORF Transcript_5006/g.18063 Transcript_5006/m.18063 type:complete len:145 (+) Transcript_5006:462-896(+)